MYPDLYRQTILRARLDEQLRSAQRRRTVTREHRTPTARPIDCTRPRGGRP